MKRLDLPCMHIRRIRWLLYVVWYCRKQVTKPAVVLNQLSRLAFTSSDYTIAPPMVLTLSG